LSGLNFLARLVNDPHVDPGTGPATREKLVLRVLVILQAGKKARFTQSVDLNKL
jgi:hypothetical protein